MLVLAIYERVLITKSFTFVVLDRKYTQKNSNTPQPISKIRLRHKCYLHCHYHHHRSTPPLALKVFARCNSHDNRCPSRMIVDCTDRRNIYYRLNNVHNVSYNHCRNHIRHQHKGHQRTHSKANKNHRLLPWRENRRR